MTRLVLAAEEVKIHLSDATVAEGVIDGLRHNGRDYELPFRLTRAQLEDMVRGFVDRAMELTKNVLTTLRLDPKKVSEVVCVGGTTRVPLVRQRLSELFGREPALRINPDEVVAQGAAIQAGSLAGTLFQGAGMSTRNAVPTSALSPLAHGDVPWAATIAPARPILLDVTPASLRVATAGGFTEEILERNLPTPIERTRTFTTARDHQTSVVIDCCRGEHRRVAENEPLGRLVLEGLPPRRRGEVRIDVTFRVDQDGILHVRARDADTGIAQEASLEVLGAPAAA
jgi:molecular chaperone DnaK